MSQQTKTKTFFRFAGSYALRGLILVCRILPVPAVLALGRCLGRVMRKLNRKRAMVALRNLDYAYGDTLTDTEKERIAAQSFENFGMLSVEMMKFPFLAPDDVHRRIRVRDEDQELFDSLVSRGKGALILSAHLGNMEIGGRLLTMRGLDIVVVVREARDQRTTKIMNGLRERTGVKVVTLKQSMRGILTTLKRGGLAGIICDQNADDVVVPFFGKPTGTVDGPARIALKTGSPILLFACYRDGKGGFEVVVHGVLEPVSTGDTQKDVETIMTWVNAGFESLIRKRPEQWLWFHDRWKSSPKVEAS